jgi:hypothetical protein
MTKVSAQKTPGKYSVVSNFYLTSESKWFNLLPFHGAGNLIKIGACKLGHLRQGTRPFYYKYPADAR